MRWLRFVHPRQRYARLGGGESGQSLIIVVIAIIALFAIMGLGVDLGLAYVERVRLARAMDAAALAGAQELPAEEAAHLRALKYLYANGYSEENACVETVGSDLGEGSCDGSEETRIWIDTLKFRDDPHADNPNTANKINVRAEQDVSLAFMRVVGFDTVPVGANATAENIEDLDIVIVYDRSGSMQEDTRCYGCWEPHDTEDYPAGSTWPLTSTVHCEEQNPLDLGGHTYLSIEAEHYSRYARDADYHRDETEFPETWWTLQRQPDVNASGLDYRGAFMMVGPHSPFAEYYLDMDDIVHPPDDGTTPRLDYDFTVPESGTYYVWMRAQGGTSWWQDAKDPLTIEKAVARRRVYVGRDDIPLAVGETPLHGPYGSECDAHGDGRGCAASPDKWRWTRVLELPGMEGPDKVYRLNFWAAGSGFSLDKIVITNDPALEPEPLGWKDGGGPGETHGRNGWACMDTKDPRFAPVDPVDPDGEVDDLYDDYQPVRDAKEAAKNFVQRMDPELDQVGYVTYNDKAQVKEELYCLKQLGSCEGFGRIYDVIETTFARGNTNIADAMWDGLRVLTTGTEPEPDPDGRGFPPKEPGSVHYGRPNAAHIMILLTDGKANFYPGMKIKKDGKIIKVISPFPDGYDDCYSDDLWPDLPDEDESENERLARECVVWFAHQARDRGVVIYTIGLGAQADNELLRHVADITGGVHSYAPKADDLDAIFQELYENIFLRLIE